VHTSWMQHHRTHRQMMHSSSMMLFRIQHTEMEVVHIHFRAKRSGM